MKKKKNVLVNKEFNYGFPTREELTEALEAYEQQIKDDPSVTHLTNPVVKVCNASFYPVQSGTHMGKSYHFIHNDNFYGNANKIRVSAIKQRDREYPVNLIEMYPDAWIEANGNCVRLFLLDGKLCGRIPAYGSFSGPFLKQMAKQKKLMEEGKPFDPSTVDPAYTYLFPHLM